MRVTLLVASALVCTVLGACDTKKKLDKVLDNADHTITNANKRIDELAKLVTDLKADASGAVAKTGAAASKALNGIGSLAGGVPATGGKAKTVDSTETVDIDEDGTPDTITAMEFDNRMLWLADASSVSDFACKTQFYIVSDKPPENMLSWGFFADGCGTLACPPEELDEAEPDFNTCKCTDADDNTMTCTDLFATLAPAGSGTTTQTADAGTGTTQPTADGGTGTAQRVYCDDGTETILETDVCDGLVDCSDGSDEAAIYCGG